MTTAREFFRFMRGTPRAGQVFQLQATVDGKYIVCVWGRELRPLVSPKATPTEALAASLCWVYGTSQHKHQVIKAMKIIPRVQDFLREVEALGWTIRDNHTIDDTWDISRTENHIKALGGSFASPKAYNG